MRRHHTGDNRGHHSSAEIHFAENTIAIARRVGAARLESIAFHRVNGVAVRVDHKNGARRSGREDRIIHRDLSGGTVRQMKTKSRLVFRVSSVDKDQVAIRLAVEDQIPG